MSRAPAKAAATSAPPLIPTFLRRSTTPSRNPTPTYSHSRTVCAATAFQPLFYRDTIRVPKQRRTFPHWKHDVVRQTILPQRVAGKTKRGKEVAEGKKAQGGRLPGWQMLSSLDIGPQKIKGAEVKRDTATAAVAAVKKERGERTRYLHPRDVLGPIKTIVGEVSTFDSQSQRDTLLQLCASVLQQFNADASTTAHHYALLPQAIARIIVGCRKLGRSDIAQEVLERYVEAARLIAGKGGDAQKAMGIVPFNALLEDFASSGNHEGCQNVLRKMAGVDLQPNAKTFNILISACTTDQVEVAWGLLETMSSLNLRPSLRALNTLLELTFAGGSSYSNQTATVYEKMLHFFPVKPGCRTGPNATTACILLRQCRTPSQLEGVFEDIRKWLLLRSARVQTELMQTANRIQEPSNRLSYTLDWANRLGGLGVPLSVQAANVIVEAYAADGALSQGLDYAMRLHEQNGAAASDELLRSVLRKVGRETERDGVDRREDRVAWDVWTKLRETSATRKSFVELVDALGRAGDARRLWYLYDLMTKKTAGTSAVRSSASTVVPHDEATQDPEHRILQHIDPTDPRLHRAFIRAFSTRLTADPTAAAYIFSSHATLNDEKSALEMLRGVRDRRDAAGLLTTLLTVAVQKGVPLTAEGLKVALEGVVERVRRQTTLPSSSSEQQPMAFSAAHTLSHLGLYNPSATHPRPLEQFALTRSAVVGAVAQGVASAAERVRGGRDVEDAVESLRRWVEGRDEGPEGVERSEAWAVGRLKEIVGL
ncbi:uncharacterized protein EV422DRAFT_542578 [Fimicolochytrium jonesii]|uniref:uncharacterized protein n=1 Tax=Fimicolochytrium jonesii TaxID=1396493 RepID=UPI0022FF160E|nr:uncharacterized protein EV422DRAFT_542578 [Fimicolochytrium jonesii]KAI8817148.1 hypothetical protein EV422DRAFT_542578 [Fimicolochytrium jonesii]